MKQFAITALVLLGLALVGCGSNSNSTSINGNWNATLLSNGSNTTTFAFGTSLTVNGDGSLTVSNFKFTTSSPCFQSGTTETGGFSISGNFSGQTNGAFTMAVQSGTPAGNTLTLNGTDHGNTISGKWTLTGSSGCTGSGTFTMNKL
jgi:hypothetical protein